MIDEQTILEQIRLRAERHFGCNELEGKCALCARAIVESFLAHGLYAQIAIGRYCSHDHCWAHDDGWNYDVTATQFSGLPVVIEEPDDPANGDVDSSNYFMDKQCGTSEEEVAKMFANWPDDQNPTYDRCKPLFFFPEDTLWTPARAAVAPNTKFVLETT